ncbi:hypothetical protein KKA14_19665 [bacterium]|nr:hypothetical protein [bacterium]
MSRKVLFINRFYHPLGKAGPSFVTRIFTEQFVKEGDQAVVLSENKVNQVFEETLNGVRVYRIPPAVNLAESEKLFIEIIEKEKPDIVHTLWIGNSIVEAILAITPRTPVKESVF